MSHHMSNDEHFTGRENSIGQFALRKILLYGLATIPDFKSNTSLRYVY